MNMLKHLAATFLTLFATLSIAQVSHAGEEVLAPAKLVVYRAEETSRTRQLKFYVRLDKSLIGKLKYGKAITATALPGQYSINTTLGDTQALDLGLRPGQTYYIRATVTMLGATVKTVLELVEEQVAVAQQPSILSVI